MFNESIKKVTEYKKRLFTTRSKAYKKVFESEEGKMVLADIYKFSKLNKSRFVPGQPDITAFQEGAAAVALHIKAVLKQDEKEIEKLLEQHNVKNL